MPTEIVRDSCVLYEHLGYEQIDRLVNGQIANLLRQKSGIKICPVCLVEHMNEGELCSLCKPDWNY